MSYRADYSWAELGVRVRDLRIARGLSQYELAQRAGITQAGLHRIERGQTNPQIESLQRIASALRTSVRQLVTGAPSESVSPWLMRIARILESRDPVAVATVENAITSAEALLDRGGHIVSSQPRSGSRRLLDDPVEFRRRTGYMHPSEFTKTAEGKAALKATQQRRQRRDKTANKGSTAFVADGRNVHV